MAKTKKDITIGSAVVMIKEYTTGTDLSYTSFNEDTDRLGYIQGGATVTYEVENKSIEDDSGVIKETIITSESASVKSGVLTWDGATLAKLCATARVTEADNIRTVKIGGLDNDNGKSYALCLHHKDKARGDSWTVVRAVNTSGFEFAFNKEEETVIDTEFTCLSQDDEGTLIAYYEEIAQ